MNKFNKDNYFYAGEFKIDDISGLGLKSNSTSVHFGNFKNGVLNGLGLISDVSRRLTMSNYQAGVPTGVTFNYVNGELLLEDKNGVFSSSPTLEFKKQYFGLVSTEGDRAIWIIPSSSTLVIRDENFEEKRFSLPFKIDNNQYLEMIDIKYRPSFISDSGDSSGDPSKGLILGGDNHYLLFKSSSYLGLGKYRSSLNLFTDFNYAVGSDLVGYQQRDDKGESCGAAVSLCQKWAKVYRAKDDNFDGLCVFYIPKEDHIVELSLYKEGKKLYTLLMNDDFSVELYDSRDHLIEEYHS